MEPKLVAEGQWKPGVHWKLYLGHPVPPRELCATAFCFAFKDGKVALTKHHRGWDVPGGHVDDGEAMEAAARREMFEETGMTVGALRFIAVLRADHDEPQARDGRPYPFPTSYGLWYAGAVESIGAIPADSESVEAAFFTPDEVRAQHFKFQPAFEEALRLATQEKFL